MKTLARIILSILLTFVVIYFLIQVGSTWRVSNPNLEVILSGFNAFETLKGFGFDFFEDPTKIVNKTQLDGYDALANGFTLYVTCYSVIPIIFLVLIVAFIYGIFTGQFVDVLLGMIIGIPIAILIAIGLPIALWLGLLFQEATGNYYVIWLLTGLPIIGVGLLSATTPSILIVYIIPIK